MTTQHPAVPTHYEVLNVASRSDQAEIRRAYHQAARRWHPDGFGAGEESDAVRAEAEMRLVNRAWEVLGDEDRRRSYDLELRRRSGPTAGGGTRVGPRADADGVIRIDPRLLDPSVLAARRHAQSDQISNRSSLILRVAPALAILGLLVAIFVFTAYARDGGDDAAGATTTLPGPSLGAGIQANDCVSVLTGPALLARPCDAAADGRVIGARLPDGVCPLATLRQVELTNGAIVCLGAV